MTPLDIYKQSLKDIRATYDAAIAPALANYLSTVNNGGPEAVARSVFKTAIAPFETVHDTDIATAQALFKSTNIQ